MDVFLIALVQDLIGWLKKTMHSSVRVDVLRVEDSHGCHVVIGVGRVIVQRHHASVTPISEFSLVTL